MSLDIFFAFLVLSPWPIFFSYLCFYALHGHINYLARIASKKAFFKHLLLLGFVVLLTLGIFLLRLERRGYSLDIYNCWSMIFGYLKFMKPLDSYFVLLGLSLLGISWIFAIKLFWMYVKRSFIIIYAYTTSYDWFRNHIFYPFRRTFMSYHTFYVVDRIAIFTKNPRIIAKGFIIWPRIPKMLEARLFRLLLPYLYLYDIIINAGMVSKVFAVLPWMFIYTALRGFLSFWHTIFNAETSAMRFKLYGFRKWGHEKKKKGKKG